MSAPSPKEGIRRESELKRANGVYYTPPPIAAEVTKWAVNSAGDFVLDPSYGGGVFLAASVRRLSLLGSGSPGRQVFGVDSDDCAEARARAITKNTIPRRQLVKADFFSVRPQSLTRRFDAVIGNPPYVKHHNIDPQLLRLAQECVVEHGFELSGRSSYWAYFVLHALQFVSPGGRLAFILPGAFLHAEYAASVREAILNNFGRVRVVTVDEQVFHDAKEESVILLAEQKGYRCREVRVGGMSKHSLHLDEESLRRCTRRVPEGESSESWMRALLSTTALEVYDELASRFMKLGDAATVRIGAVTGDNRYFTLRPSELQKAGVPRRYARPIITQATHLRAAVLSRADVERLLREDARVLLFSPPRTGRMHPKVAEYLRLGESLGLPSRHKCSTRKPWYLVPDSSPPNALLLYMTGTAPRLILNKARATCTNTIHAVTWRDPGRAAPASAALALLTTLAQLGAELEGRSYGDGVLKIEPSAANRLPLPMDSRTNKTEDLARADHLLRLDKADEAVSLADQAMLSTIASEDDMALLREAVLELRNRRTRRGSSKPER